MMTSMQHGLSAGRNKFITPNMTRDNENRRIGFYLMEDVGISKETIIYHYMDIKHLCYLLDNGVFLVNRKCNFEDKFEKELLIKKKRFAFSIVGNNAPQQNSNRIQDTINKKRVQFSSQSSMLTSCWSQGPSENYLMWKSYTTPNCGVCIKTTIGKFAESLCEDSYELWCGKIQYAKREQTTPIEEAEWIKNPEYFGEKEIRFYFKKTTNPPYKVTFDNTNAVFIAIDYRKLIDQIIMSPDMWVNDIKRWSEYLSITYKIEETKICKSSI